MSEPVSQKFHRPFARALALSCSRISTMRLVGLNRSPSRPTSASYSSSSGMISSRTIARTAAMSGRTLSVTPRSTLILPESIARYGAETSRAASGMSGNWVRADASADNWPRSSVSAHLAAAATHSSRPRRYRSATERFAGLSALGGQSGLVEAAPRKACSAATTCAPSPTAPATRFTDFARTSPIANTPRRVVSRDGGRRRRRRR